MRSGERRWAIVAALIVAVLGTALLAITKYDGAVAERKVTSVGSESRDIRARFVVLSQAQSNQCGLQARSIDSIAENGRLQGSCCSAMDLHRYREQVDGLRRYSDVPEIPRDPYDIPVGLAKRLISYHQTIELTPEQNATYDRAVRLSDEGGPCCCRCWRWTAFEGQAKFLIARRRFSAAQIANIWDLEDGCGGEGHAHSGV
jgi:hypothetical protein